MCNEPHYGHLGVASGKNREGKIRKTMRKKINEKIFLSYSPCLVAEYFQLLGGSASFLLEAFNQSLAVGWLGMWKDDRSTGGKLGPDHSLHTVFTHGPQTLSSRFLGRDASRQSTSRCSSYVPLSKNWQVQECTCTEDMLFLFPHFSFYKCPSTS